MLRKTDLRSKKSLLVYCYSNLPNFSTHENIFYWLLQPDQIRFRRVEFLIKFVFPYLWICAEFSKRLLKVSLNKGMLKCKTFSPTRSKLNRAYRRVLFYLFIYLIRYLKSMFTIVKKLIYIDNKKNLIKWKNWNW